MLFLLTSLCFQSCKVQQTRTSLPKIENQIKGELDYTKGDLELIQYQKNGDEITIGNINKEGSVQFNLPEFDIKAIYKNQGNINFHHQFGMIGCPGKEIFDRAEPPYDDVYSQIYAPIYVKKHGLIVAYIYPISDEELLIKENYNKITGSQFYWFYIDRAIDYKDECIKASFNDSDLEVSVSADIQFKSGWNFIRKNFVAVQNYGENNDQTTPKKIHFTRSSPESKEVKWYLERRADEKIIKAAKNLDNLTPITKEQFEKWLPKKVNDFTRTSSEVGKELYWSSKKNNAFLVFENGNQKIEVAVIDIAQSLDDLQAVSSSLSTSKAKVDEGVRYVSTYNEERKAFRIKSFFKGRIAFDAMGYNITEEQLWETIKSIQIEKLIKQ